MVWKKVLGVIVLLFGCAVMALLVGNAMDYYRFHRVIRRLENLTDEQFRALGDAAARIKAPQRGDSPAGFEILHALRASPFPGSSDFLLYELKPARPRYEDDHLYLYVRISTSPSNQEIVYFTNSAGPQRTKVLWNRNPEFARKHAPLDRIVTVSVWDMHDGRKWIVLRDRILVVDEHGTVGSEPAIAGSAPLDAEGLARIKGAIAKLHPAALGKDYRAEGVADGLGLGINFSSDGERGPTSVWISNTWVEDFRPLVAAVSELGPKDCRIDFIESITTDENLRHHRTIVRTLEEWENSPWEGPNLPWFGLWRRLVN